MLGASPSRCRRRCCSCSTAALAWCCRSAWSTTSSSRCCFSARIASFRAACVRLRRARLR
ncbi:hypothetical protein PF005_g19863 [Phytophthora fragariae]|uniref:Uncharacterized protein n=1 Tax=Phytophthora fragariae TaxID=53985 RepID=A0A6A3R8D3_9STRA|nr:hypothetical protein PF003_g23672 [Phytophthora fragariae]KAE8929239.1 hypothetical protein PF009_g20641 [Phytophthora fragariae]KAE9009275.1 hypothetical protein PF011_g10341 [Phytophthora fragariae]KAE9088410.1 hypothetical protein PF007_g19986 [Phytophthora fragariae]KAE9088512.1 hypothetical protein PF010_g19351 [Phytophthora fragariae]